MNLEKALEQFGRKLAEEADVRAVFGDPLELGGHVVVPVAAVRIVLSAEGGGRADLSATPVGWLGEEGGEVVFKPIELFPGRPRRRAGKVASRRRR